MAKHRGLNVLEGTHAYVVLDQRHAVVTAARYQHLPVMRHGSEVVKASSNLPHALYRLLLRQLMQWDFSPAEDVIWSAQAHCKLFPSRERHRARDLRGFVRVCNLVLRYKKMGLFQKVLFWDFMH